MQTLICKNPDFHLLPHFLQSKVVSLPNDINRNFVNPHAQFCSYTLRTRISCTATSSQSPSFGGWDDFQPSSGYLQSGESNQLDSFLNSLGIGDKKYIFVYLFGFVCALVISRIKISSIVIFPACAILFAIGFSAGFVKGGHFKELKLNVTKQKILDETLTSSIEKLRNLGDSMEGCNSMFLNLKNDIKRGIECNQVTLGDLEGYTDVIESANKSFMNAMDILEIYIQSMLSGNQEKEVASKESIRQNKKSGEMSFNFSQYLSGLFGKKYDIPMSDKVKDSIGLVDLDGKNRNQANILCNSVEGKEVTSTWNVNVKGKTADMFDHPFDSVESQSGAKRFSDQTESIVLENVKMNEVEKNDRDKVGFDQTVYDFQNNTSRFVKSRQVHLKDYQDELESMEFQSSSYDSVDFIISMNHTKGGASYGRREKARRKYSQFETIEENETDSKRFSYKKEKFYPRQQPLESKSEPFGNNLEFEQYLTEASNLLKEAKISLRQKVDDGCAEHALNKSAILLSKATVMRPMSLLAVGQLGNTYLLHGELKLRMSQELRSLLTRSDYVSVEEWKKVLKRFDDQLCSKDEITSALIDVCEECEELLIKAGRKYKMALSIDGNDMRALYNWGLALSFRAQLIADIGPAAARDADKVFLAAIDKFDAMMSRSNVYAPDALFRWGGVLQQRSRLRPSNSREKVKLLQQARRLYEDALQMDSGNFQLQEALSSCVSELENWLY